MAKRIPLDGEWTLTGTSPYDREGVSLSLSLQEGIESALRRQGLLWGGARCGEWIYLRSWRFSRPLQRPNEPPEGESERYHLYLGALCGKGQVISDGQVLGALSPYEQIDLSKQILSGSCPLELRFEPALLAGEHAMPALLDPPLLVASYFSRITSAKCRGSADGRLHVSLEIEGYGQGRVQIKYRLLKNDALCASLTTETRLQACLQTIEETLELAHPSLWPGEDALYTLLVTLERGGARCDSVEISACFLEDENAEPPLLLGRLVEEICPSGVYGLGLRGMVLHGLPSKAVLHQLSKEGLSAWLLTSPCGTVPDKALARGFAPHGCARFLGGFGYAFADGSPADGRDARLSALEQQALLLNLRPNHAFFLDEIELPEGPGFERACTLFNLLTAMRHRAVRRMLPLEKGLLFDEDGLPTQEAAAMAAAMAPVSVHVQPPSSPLYPGMALSLQLFPLGNVQGVLLLEAKLYTLSGRCLRDAAFTLTAYRDPTAPLYLDAKLPSPLTEPLLLRLRLKKNEDTLWQWDDPLFAEQLGFSPLPLARILLARSGDAWYAVNKGDTAALGLLTWPEPRLLALLPGEGVRAQGFGGGERCTWIRLEDEDVSC